MANDVYCENLIITLTGILVVNDVVVFISNLETAAPEDCLQKEAILTNSGYLNYKKNKKKLVLDEKVFFYLFCSTQAKATTKLERQ